MLCMGNVREFGVVRDVVVSESEGERSVNVESGDEAAIVAKDSEMKMKKKIG